MTIMLGIDLGILLRVRTNMSRCFSWRVCANHHINLKVVDVQGSCLIIVDRRQFPQSILDIVCFATDYTLTFLVDKMVTVVLFVGVVVFGRSH